VEAALVVLVVAIALGFDYTNGFHDAANAIATSVSTRALTPRVALGMAAVMNFVGALLGTEVAETIATSIVDLQDASNHTALVVVLCALVGAIAWNLITWWFGLPSSSTHSLIGGLVGAGLAAGLPIYGQSIIDKVVLPMIFSPLIGFVLAYLVMVAVLWIFRNAAPSRVTRRFRIAQTASAAAMALGHGLQDAQKTMGVIYMALVTVGWADADGGIPLWVKLAAAGAISLGTYSGGWRIMRTLGRRIIELDPARGFVAESVSALVLYANAFILHAPVSTTHTITSAIMGVGATRRLSAVRWGVAKNIGAAWVLTIPAAALVAALTTWILHPWLAA
jgi:inorganic phosphate transporter, PiT family